MCTDDLFETVESRFRVLQNKTLCPYAPGAKPVIGVEWVKEFSVPKNVMRHLPALRDFSEQGALEAYDMYVMEVRGESLIGSIDSLSTILKQVLLTIRQNDSTQDALLNTGIETLAWDFVFHNVKYFVPVFGPFYPMHHPRYSHSPGSAFILFQPDHSFTRRRVTSKNPNRGQISERVHTIFAEAGSEYDINLAVGTPKAIRYIKPVAPDAPPVKWWTIDA